MFRKKRPIKPHLTQEEAAAILNKLEDPSAPDPFCQNCKGLHVRACPRVKRFVFQGAEVKEVEFFEHWDESGILFPDEVARIAEDI